MKPKYFYLILLFAVTGFLALNAFISDNNVDGNGKGTGNEKIIKFSHKVHAEVTDCQSCHSKAAQSKSLKEDLYPAHPDCAACHDVEDTNNCKMCHYEDNFQPLNYKKPELMFNHSFHISDQKLECKSCHMGIDQVDYGYQAVPQPYPPMSMCNTCHNNSKEIATNECEACHVSTANLRPVSHQTNNFRKTHKFDAVKNDANCAMCHDNTSCQECHVATNMLTEKNTSTNFYAPYTPTNFASDGPMKQKITRIHDLNYVYTHGIDLKGGTTECQTCHQVETFCVECHTNSNGHDYAITGIMPASHRVPNFVIPATGSGGGEHGRDAKRDIESCASCHDTQGGDPACIRCHIDNDGVQGTNPKTHQANYMHDTKGDWHDTQASLCYNCHITATPNSPKGVGFCGYCHK
ncbi:MAG: cytochrome c3 family protein [Ignavibacteriales bacterium]